MSTFLRRHKMLHRGAALVCALALLSVPALRAQRSRKRSAGPRALALLELAANGRARLVPVAIMVGGKFYDGDSYRANPRPMALDSDIVYEAERGGESIGLFTVNGAQVMKDVWIGVGQWRANNAPEPKKAAAKVAPPEDSDQPPVLRKSGSSEKPAPPAPAPATAAPPPAPAKPAKAEPRLEAEDSGRPTLRRGKPTDTQAADNTPPVTTQKPGSTPASQANAAPVQVLTAISDAAGPEPRPFTMMLRPDERTRYEQQVSAMAYAAVQQFAAARPQHKPAAASALHVTNFQVYDVSYNNEPVMVLTGTLPELAPRGGAAAQQYFVTAVARVDIYGELKRLFAQVTDTTHLDAYPRLELLDAVDAEGSGSGQLLFREVSDTGYKYTLYRVGADRLWPLFASAQKSF